MAAEEEWLKVALDSAQAAQSAAKKCGALVRRSTKKKQDRMKLMWKCMKYYKYQGEVPASIDVLTAWRPPE